jgi:hypothetical protein
MGKHKKRKKKKKNNMHNNIGLINLPPETSKEVTFASCPESVLTGLKSRADQIFAVIS